MTRLQFHLFPNERHREVKRWGRDSGYEKHRFNYDFGPESVVIDLGGYKGQYAADIFSRFLCKVHVFEPVIRFADKIETRFARNPHVHVYAYGLGGVASTAQVALEGAASSAFLSSSAETETIEIRPILEFMDDHGLASADLLKMNIEGGEYELLEYLLDNDAILRFANIQIQFHDLFEGAEQRMEAIQQRLRKTHELTFHYKFMMENWALKANA